MLPLKHRLDAKYFKKIYTEGRKYRGEYGMLVAKDSTLEYAQFAFVISKKIGNAVQRHRMTRLLRQITLETLSTYSLSEKPFQCQYIGFKYCDSYEKLKEEYSEQIKQALGVS